MTNEELQQLNTRLGELENQVNSLVKNPALPDHYHNGFDSSRVRFIDFDRIVYYQLTIDPGSLVDGAGQTMQITGISGVTLGDFVLVSAPYDLQDITVTAYVQATGVIEIRIQNESGATVDLASGIWKIIIIKIIK